MHQSEQLHVRASHFSNGTRFRPPRRSYFQELAFFNSRVCFAFDIACSKLALSQLTLRILFLSSIWKRLFIQISFVSQLADPNIVTWYHDNNRSLLSDCFNRSFSHRRPYSIIPARCVICTCFVETLNFFRR